MTTRHRRARGSRAARWTVPGSVATAAWLAVGDPMGAGGLASLLLLALAAGLLYPLAVILLAQAPGALVPDGWRASWRRGREGRPHVPGWLRRAVYAADGNACCYCRSGDYLNLDHVKPWARGGRTTFWNMMTLCRSCNLVKSDYWEPRGGHATYHPWDGHANAAKAREILECELRRRYGVIRLMRAALAL